MAMVGFDNIEPTRIKSVERVIDRVLRMTAIAYHYMILVEVLA